MKVINEITPERTFVVEFKESELGALFIAHARMTYETLSQAKREEYKDIMIPESKDDDTALHNSLRTLFYKEEE